MGHLPAGLRTELDQGIRVTGRVSPLLFLDGPFRHIHGNVLITESEGGRLLEVTRDGEIVWEFRCLHTNPQGQRATILRMFRLPAAQIDALLNGAPKAVGP